MANVIATLTSDYNGDDEFGPYGELLELIEAGGAAWMREGRPSGGGTASRPLYLPG
jgi:hypothetical protein